MVGRYPCSVRLPRWRMGELRLPVFTPIPRSLKDSIIFDHRIHGREWYSVEGSSSSIDSCCLVIPSLYSKQFTGAPGQSIVSDGGSRCEAGLGLSMIWTSPDTGCLILCVP